MQTTNQQSKQIKPSSQQQQQQQQSKQPAPPLPPKQSQPNTEDINEKNSFFGMFFNPKGHQSQQQQQQQQSISQAKTHSQATNQPNVNTSQMQSVKKTTTQQTISNRDSRLQQVPASLYVSSIPQEKEFEIELLGII